jgi:proteasome lid subunit RPN8/RPN11
VPEVVTLTKEVSSALRAHAEAAYPEECVGALLSDGSVRALSNAAVDRRRGFLVSAKDTIELLSSFEVSGYYHSHPDGPAVPSREDAAQANEGMLTLIISVMNGVASPPRAFRFAEGKFVEEPVHHETGEPRARV